MYIGSIMIEIQNKNKLELIPINKNDQNELFTLINTNRKYLGKYLKWVEFTNSVSDLDNFIILSEKLIENNAGGNYKIQYNDQFIGIISTFINDKENKVFEIGYWITQEYANKGIISECVKKIETIIIINYKAKKIELRCAVENIPSNKVAKKNNYLFINVLSDCEEILGQKLDYNRYEKSV